MLDTLALAAARAAPLASGTAPSIPWGRLVLAFVFCILVALAAIAFIRKRNGMPVLPEDVIQRFGQGQISAPAASGRVQIVQRLGVTPTSQLVVLKRGRQNYLLHLTNSGATEIDRYLDDGEVEEA